MSNLERRFATRPLELRATGTESQPTVQGYAALFGSPTIIHDEEGTYQEIIRAGAFADCLSNPDMEVLGLLEHDDNKILCRRSEGTLKLIEDETGLYVEMVPCATTRWADTLEDLRVRNYKGMSFAFYSDPDSEIWSVVDGVPRREIARVRGLDDVTITVRPAYPQTSVWVRSQRSQLKKTEPTSIIDVRGLLLREKHFKLWREKA